MLKKKEKKKWSYHANQLHLELAMIKGHLILCPESQAGIFLDLNLHGRIHYCLLSCRVENRLENSSVVLTSLSHCQTF